MATVLSVFSDALAELVANTASGVASVSARRQMPASGIIWSADGIIVTADHVVEQEDSIEVGLPDGRSVSATLVGRDPTTDLAVLRASATGLSALSWTDPDDLKVGHLVLALGRPGHNVAATLGVISALEGGWLTSAGGRVDRYIHTDVVMFPGFSGGPLIGASGGVVGLNTSGLRRAASITLPKPTVVRVVETLLTKGRISRGYLGLGSQPVRLPQSIAQGVGQETGLLVVSVAQGSPAEQSGLLLGDTIVAIAGQPVRSMEDLLVYLNDAQVGSSVPVRIVRGGATQDVNVSIGERG